MSDRRSPLKLYQPDDGAAKQPPPPPRTCSECRALVTTLGRTEGVFCDRGSCPHPRLGTAYRAAVGERGWQYQPGEGE